MQSEGLRERETETAVEGLKGCMEIERPIEIGSVSGGLRAAGTLSNRAGFLFSSFGRHVTFFHTAHEGNTN